MISFAELKMFVAEHRLSRAASYLAGSLLLTVLVVLLSPSPPKVEIKKEALLVSGVFPRATDERFQISGFGSVRAARELDVRPEVSGRIVSLHPDLQVGGRILEGEVLLQIDPRDYEIALDAAKAQLARAEFELQLEKGNQRVAEKEWELLKDSVEADKLSEELALRKPQLREKEASFEAAKSQVKRAQLDLDRTSIIAPFPLVVLSEDVEVGLFVNSMTSLLRVAATDEFHIEVRVPRSSLTAFDAGADGSLPEARAVIRERFGDGSETVREGSVLRLLGDVDPNGRMAKILVSLPDPLTSNGKQRAILIGAYTRVELWGRSVVRGFRVPQSAIREGNTVWSVAADRTVKTVAVSPLFQDGDEVILRSEELSTSDRVIITAMQSMFEGTLVRFDDDPPEAEAVE